MTWIFFLLLLCAAPAQAATYYVTTTGSGSECSIGSPCGSIATGVSKLTVAGDILDIANGTYTEGINLSGATTPANGTSYANATTIRGNGATIIQPSGTGIAGLYIYNTSRAAGIGFQYIVVQNIIFDGSNVTGPGAHGVTYGDNSGAYHHIRVTACEIRHWYNNGALVNGDFLWFDHNNVWDNGTANLTIGGGHGVYWTARDSIIEYNYIHDNLKMGAQNYNASGNVHRNVWRYNLFEDNDTSQNPNGGANLTLLSGADNVAHGNISIGARYGITSGASNASVYNNTVVNTTTWCYSSNATNSFYRNNICVPTSGGRFNDFGSGNTYSTNLCSSAGTNCAVVGDPLFVGGGNYSLQSGSPAINAGTNIAGYPRNAACHANAAIGAYHPICIVSAEIGAIANTTLVVNIGNDAFPGTLPTSSCSAGWSVDYDAVPATISSVTCPSAGSNQIRLTMQSAPASSAVAVTVSYDASTGATTDNSNFGNQAVNQELFSTTDFAVTNTVGGTPPSQNLIAAYGLNEGTGATTDDETGNALNGTITGAAWTGSGVSGDSLTFDGSGDDVTVADDDLLDLSNSFTVAAWVYPTTANTDFRAIAVKNYKIYLYASVSGYCGAGAVLGGFSGAGGARTACYATPLATNTWTYVALTYDGTDLKLYTGAASAMTLRTTTSIVDAASPSTGSFQIGASQFGEVFQGRIDEVRIWNYARSEVQLETDMDDPISDITPPTQPLLTQTNYRFDCPGGTADSPDCSYAQNQPVTIPPGKCTRVRVGFTNSVADYGSTGLGLYFQKNGTGGYSALADGPCGATSICYINGTGKPLTELTVGNVTAQLIPSDPNFVGGGTLLTATEIPSIPFTNGKNGENVAAICAGDSTVAGTDYFELEYRAPNNTSIAINNRPRINIGGYKTSIGAP